MLSDDDYVPKQGRNARRQAKRTGTFFVHHPDEQLSSEVRVDILHDKLLKVLIPCVPEILSENQQNEFFIV